MASYNEKHIKKLNIQPEDISRVFSLYEEQGHDISGFEIGDQIRLECLDYSVLDKAVRHFQARSGLTPDGKLGPATRKAVDAAYDKGDLDIETRRANARKAQEVRAERMANMPTWEIFTTSNQPSYPRRMSDLGRTFGQPMHGNDVIKDWQRKNIVECHPRGDRPPMLGVPEKFWFKVNRHVEPHMREAFRRFSETPEAETYKIYRAGGWVPRRVRHNPKGSLSTHAYGVAVDINPPDNKLIRMKNVPEPFSPEYYEIWPAGIGPMMVAAFESCGFFWGYWFKGSPDPMHFQWCALSSEKYAP